MKKITHLFFLLFTGLIFSQTSNFCDTEVLHLNIPAETASAINLTIENTGTDTMKLTANASDSDVTFLAVQGTPIAGGAATSSMMDTSVPGEVSITLTWGTPPTGDVTFQFIQWEKTSTGTARWQINDATTPFDGTCVQTPAEDDVTLADLQLDNATITDFSPTTISYDVSVPEGDPIPQVTSVVTTNSMATVSTITQASQIPGSASFTVTSESGNFDQMYTINFEVGGPADPAPDFPTFSNTTDFTSIFSSSGDAIGLVTSSFAGASEETISIDGNDTKQLTIPTGGGGMNFAFAGQDLEAGEWDTLYFNYYFEGTLEVGRVINVNIQGGGANLIYTIDLSPTTRTADQWVTVDVPFSSLANGTDATTDISQVQFTGAGGSNPIGTLFIDNIAFYKSGTLSLDEVNLSQTRIYPNPTSNSWTIQNTSLTIDTIEVFDILGKRVQELTPNAQDAVIDAINLKTGIYLAKLYSGDAVSTVKLIRQ